MDVITSDLLAELECSVCTDYMLPPIRMCENGHNICNGCKEKLEKCPTCKGTFMSGRCIALEKLAYKIHYPCKYRDSGCNQKFLVELIKDHQEECIHRPHRCPFSLTWEKCSWEGPIIYIKEHIKCSHTKANNTNDVSGKYRTGLPNFETSNAWYQAVFTLGEVFFQFNKVKGNLLFICFLHVGSKEKASTYRYKVTMKTPDGTRSVSACHVTENYQNDVDEVFRKGNCAAFHFEFAKTCVNAENKLPLEIEIFST